MGLPLVVAITGATGVIYGVEMLRVLQDLARDRLHDVAALLARAQLAPHPQAHERAQRR